MRVLLLFFLIPVCVGALLFFFFCVITRLECLGLSLRVCCILGPFKGTKKVKLHSLSMYLCDIAARMLRASAEQEKPGSHSASWWRFFLCLYSRCCLAPPAVNRHR